MHFSILAASVLTLAVAVSSTSTKTFTTLSTKRVTKTNPPTTKTVVTSASLTKVSVPSDLSMTLSLHEPIPTYDTPKPAPTTGAASLTKAVCYWKSQASLYVSWVLVIPQYDGKSVDDMKGDFIGSIDQNSACRGVSPIKVGAKEWYSVGPGNKNVLIAISSSDFCTAYQMTNVIKDTTGGKQSTACTKFEDSGVDPDVSNTLTDLWEGAEDGEEGNLKRAAANSTTPQHMSDAAMAKLLGMPASSSHQAIVQKLSGPSPLDNKKGTKGTQ